MSTEKGSLTIGVIGDGSSPHSLFRTLGHVFGKRGTLQTPNTEMFCVSDTVRVHLIDINITGSRRKHAVRYISQCDVIIYIASAVQSALEILNENTPRMMRRYLQIGHVFGVKHFIIAINKMGHPLVSYSEEIFDEIKERVNEIVDKTNVEDYRILPITICSWYSHWNIDTKSNDMEWYDGPLLKEIINDIKPNRNDNGPGQLSVTFINRNRGIIVGKMVCGKLSVGDYITTFPAGKKAKVKSIGCHFESVDEAVCGDVIGIKLKATDQNHRYSLCRGDLIQSENDPVGGRVH